MLSAFLVLLSLCCALPSLHAEPVYTLQQLVDMAMQQHPRLQAAREQVNAARAAVETARALPKPEVEWNGGRQRARLPGAPAGSVQSLSLTQRLDLPPQRAARIDAAGAFVTAEQAQLRTVERDQLRRIKLHYHELRRRQAEFGTAVEDMRTSAQILERVTVRVNTGEAPRYDAIKADAEFLNAQKSMEAARLRVETARALLRNAVGADLPAQFELAAETPELPELPPLEALQRQALANNADLAQVRALTARAREQVRLERSLRLPAVAVRAGYDQDPEVRGSRVGLVVSIPIWDRRQGPVAEAGAQLSRLQYEQSQSEFALRQNLEAAYRQYQISRNQVAALESGILRQAEEALRVAEAAYRFGERGILDYLDAQRVFRNARNELIAARYEVQAAMVDIQTLHQE
ncbi:TolC family protein [Noviherbaspirillum humi]|uniref:TolC family protein n=1 Tax=Noviherbaspirillum humi TaxID=1688639 RepID=UPI001FED01DF|nr:TolC family protein [Noviherbaspirillum humi]